MTTGKGVVKSELEDTGAIVSKDATGDACPTNGQLGALAAGQAMAQADSTTGNRAGNWTAVIPRTHLDLPPAPTPIVNNITQVTQVVQPNTYTCNGSWAGGPGAWLATSTASCDAGHVLVGGGGQCSTGQDSWGRAKSSYPSGNTWYHVCGANENGSTGLITALATVVCSY